MVTLTAGFESPWVPSAFDLHEQDNAPTSFYRKNYKRLRVTGEALHSRILSVCYRIISIFCKIFQYKEASELYAQLSDYYSRRGRFRSGVYNSYGDKLINFSINCGVPKKLEKPDSDRIGQLTELYGEKFIEMLNKARTEDFPILSEKLTRRSVDEGICYGDSLDFISRFLKLKASSRKCTFEIIEQISALYKDQGTIEAQITQIIYESKDKSKLKNAISEMKKARKEMEEKMAIFKIKYADSDFEFLRENALDWVKSINECEKSAKRTYELIDLLHNPLAELHNLKMTLGKHFYPDDLKDKDPRTEFNRNVDELIPGAYYFGVPEHAMVYIKESETEGYLFEPNYGAVLLSGNQERNNNLWNIAHQYRKDDKFSVAFNLCELI